MLKLISKEGGYIMSWLCTLIVGPKAAGMALIPSILGAVILVAVVSFFFGKRS